MLSHYLILQKFKVKEGTYLEPTFTECLINNHGTIIQSEVSQKEKHQYSTLMHIYGIQKDGNDDPVCETAKETQM